MSNKNKKNAAASEHGTYTYYQFPCPNNNGHIGHELGRSYIISPLLCPRTKPAAFFCVFVNIKTQEFAGVSKFTIRLSDSREALEALDCALQFIV